ncbi:MAG TPA: homogentisate phytyltransferase [Solirubrobacteraceae bacterium]|nr:homogentisate phytyltransferase [Solirubrobacteraceae bacterium]
MTPASASSPVPALTRGVGILWRFARPHTVIGTSVSVVALFAIAAVSLPEPPGPASAALHLSFTLLAGLAVNVFIVGVNQITDVEIDRVNKPFLPMAAGELSPRGATWIVAVAGVLPVTLALTQGPVELGFVAAGLLVGAVYSLPPLRLKRFPTAASLCISGVRAIVVNLGVYLHFALAFSGDASVAPAVWALTVVVVPFAFAIAILKDVPDIEGDRRYAIATFSVRLGPRRVTDVGMAALTAAYLGMAVAGPLLLADLSAVVMVAGHLTALAVLWRWHATLAQRDFPAFYLGVWKLFFAEYAIVATAALAGA